jgi:hypothetical protein
VLWEIWVILRRFLKWIRCPCPLLEEIDICDKDGNMKYYITGQFCQCGFIARLELCPRCCGPCRFIQFNICDVTK